MNDLYHISETQLLALDKLTALVGIVQINNIVAQVSEVLQAYLKITCAMRQRKLAKFMTM